MFGQTNIMLLVMSCYRQMTKSCLFFQNWRIYLVSGEQTWKVVSFLLSASWMQAFAASMFFDWNYYKCSVYIGNWTASPISWCGNTLDSKRNLNATLSGQVPENAQDLWRSRWAEHQRDITKGWLPICCVYIGECTKGTQRGWPLQRETQKWIQHDVLRIGQSGLRCSKPRLQLVSQQGIWSIHMRSKCPQKFWKISADPSSLQMLKSCFLRPIAIPLFQYQWTVTNCDSEGIIPLLVEFPPKIQGITVGSFGSFASYTTHQNISKLKGCFTLILFNSHNWAAQLLFLLVFFPSQFRSSKNSGDVWIRIQAHRHAESNVETLSSCKSLGSAYVVWFCSPLYSRFFSTVGMAQYQFVASSRAFAVTKGDATRFQQVMVSCRRRLLFARRPAPCWRVPV